MEYLRQRVDSNMLGGIFNLPYSLRNKPVEVIILPAEEPKSPGEKSGTAYGCLKKYANPELIPQEEGAWGRAMVEKYAGS